MKVYNFVQSNWQQLGLVISAAKDEKQEPSSSAGDVSGGIVDWKAGSQHLVKQKMDRTYDVATSSPKEPPARAQGLLRGLYSAVYIKEWEPPNHP